MPIATTCESCVFYTAVNQSQGTCRRHAPTPQLPEGRHPYAERKDRNDAVAPTIILPLVLKTHGCGEAELGG